MKLLVANPPEFSQDAAAGKARSSKLVFIGRDLDKMGLAEGFDACKAA